MKSKMLLLISIGALTLGASAQNLNAGYVRGSVRQPNAVTKSASATGASSTGARVRQPNAISKSASATGASSTGASVRQPNAISKSASATDASSDVGASVVLGVIDHRR